MKKYVADLYEKIQGESTGLGNLLSKIPGLDGYMERSRRREADQLLRETIVARLEEARLHLGQVQEKLGRDMVAAMDHAEPLGQVDTRLMGLIGKIRDAPQGYAGFFDAVKVKEEDLARLYVFDEQFLTKTDQIALNVVSLEKTVDEGGDVGAAIRELDDAVREANATFAERNETLMGIS